jgi:hypothetical protein
MPIKYNLTKHDLLAEEFHDIQKKNPPFDEDDQMRAAKAILIACFSSAHSWRTSNALNGNFSEINSPSLKDEYLNAKKSGWKQVRNTDIQEVSRANIKSGAFNMWLVKVPDRSEHEIYRDAWRELNALFNEACDNVAVQKQR